MHRRSRHRYESITVIRAGAGDRDNTGVYSEGQAEEITLKAIVDPMSSAGMFQLRNNTSGGQRISQAIEVFIESNDIEDIKSMDDQGANADKIQWKGQTYIVQSVVDFSYDSHFEVVAVRLDVQP